MSMFSVSLFAFSQIVIFSGEVLTFASSLLTFLFVKERLASSANGWKEASESDLCISLIYTKKSNGHRTLPCGTPNVVVACLDVLPPIFTHWVLSERQDFISFRDNPHTP